MRSLGKAFEDFFWKVLVECFLFFLLLSTTAHDLDQILLCAFLELSQNESQWTKIKTMTLGVHGMTKD